jgi:transposase-like protein
MANRKIPIETKVKVMAECLSLVNVEATAADYGVSSGAIDYWFNKKIKSRMSEILVNDPPGPKPEVQSEPKGVVTEVKADRPTACSECGSSRIWKNGTYTVINWVWLLTVGWLVGLQQVIIQRWRCAACGCELNSPERQRQAEARRAWWQQVRRLIGLGRFKLGLSVRKTQVLIAFQYGRTVSVGYIQRQTQAIGQRAQAVLEGLNLCRQKVARFLLYRKVLFEILWL